MTREFFPSKPTLPVILLGSLGLWLGFPNDILVCPFLVLFWPVALLILSDRASSPKEAFLSAWISTFLGTSFALYWLRLPIQDVGGLPFLFALGCALFVSAILSLQGAFFSFILRFFTHSNFFAKALFAALLWGALELLASVLFGFPWLPLTGALIVEPITVQVAELIGMFSTSALWVLIVSLFLLPLLHAPKKVLLTAPVALLLFAALMIFSSMRLNATSHNASPSLEVLFVEGNVDQNQKWIPSLQEETVDHYIRLTLEGLSKKEGHHPFILWSETCMPFFFERNQHFAKRIRDLASDTQCLLLFGAPAEERRGYESLIFNRATLLSPNGATLGIYDKEHLVPFGEYSPAFLNFSFLEPLLQGVGIYSEGENNGPLTYENMRAGMLICYEGIFPWLAQKRVSEGANILIDISNDSWFQDTPASLQHLYLTCLRAIEQNRFILRATNSGISAVIDTRGRILIHGPLFEEGSFFAHASLEEETSFFHRTWIAQAVFLSLLFLGLGYTGLAKKKN